MFDPKRAVEWYQKNRARSTALFDLVAETAYYSRPIALRHPLVFYEGHLPAFSFNTLVKKALGGASIDAGLETLFARGIDPHEANAGKAASQSWPDRGVVRVFAAEADARVIDALEHADLDRPGDPLLDHAEAVFAILEHEAMHQETLLYMWQRLPYEHKRKPAGYSPQIGGAVPPRDWIDVPAGCATLGVDRGSIPFGWDNEFGAIRAMVSAFAIERHNVSNAAFLEFVEAGGYQDPRWWGDKEGDKEGSDDWRWLQAERVSHPIFWERDGDRWWWRGMFELVPLPLAWPVYVSQAEASAYARWRGFRLPTEAEYQRAAYGSPDGERLYPWGNEPPTPARGVFDFSRWDPAPCGIHGTGASAWGVQDLVGNGWEWTGTTFAPFPGFQPMGSYPEYSADFFDGEHMVMKGASQATAHELIRPTLRNWFRTRYPYVYATFRCVRPA
jgi:ergothioneine biosynthesis protein EgtB